MSGFPLAASQVQKWMQPILYKGVNQHCRFSACNNHAVSWIYQSMAMNHWGSRFSQPFSDKIPTYCKKQRSVKHIAHRALRRVN